MENERNAEIVVPGDPKGSYTCITAEERPFASHCWIRAAHHICEMKNIEYFVRMEAYKVCYQVAVAVAAKMKAPQRVEPVPGFSWTSFKTIKPIR